MHKTPASIGLGLGKCKIRENTEMTDKNFIQIEALNLNQLVKFSLIRIAQRVQCNMIADQRKQITFLSLHEL